MRRIVTGLVVFIISFSQLFSQNRINHNNQEIFLSGINLAWINFSQDLTSFSQGTFTKALDDVAKAGGNSLRWWLHIDGRYSPIFSDNKVSGITQTEIDNMKLALDLAYERNIGLVMSLWSFDMLRTSIGATYYNRNKLILTDTVYSNAYINNALIPVLQQIGEHPAVICWEVFNEPEGMSAQHGWSFTQHVPMSNIQRFVNLVAGTVHREAPGAKVSNGSWSFIASTDNGSYTNYYSDLQLVNAGGDTLGKLDFYMVHYYDWGGTALSPFHHPASYWNLDKPIVIAEFSAKGPYTGIDPKTAYNYLYENGYAGAISWTWTNHDGNGGIIDAAAGIGDIYFSHPENIIIDYDSNGINLMPEKIAKILDTALFINSGDVLNYIDLKTIFKDREDSTFLSFSITGNTNTLLLSVDLSEDSLLNFYITDAKTGFSGISVMAADSQGLVSTSKFYVFVYDTVNDNVALNRKIWSSSLQGVPGNANDGLASTSWTSSNIDNQWLILQLDTMRNVQQIELKWGNIYAIRYDILSSTNNTDWTTLYTTNTGNGGSDVINFSSTDAKYIKLNCRSRSRADGSTGYRLNEMNVYETMIIPSSITQKEDKAGIDIYPVPATERLYIHIPEGILVNKMEVYNSQSQLVKSFNNDLSKNIELPVYDLNKGVYYIIFYADNLLVRKIVIN